MPIDLGGHASGLAEAQRQLGHEAEAISLHWSPLGFNGPWGTTYAANLQLKAAEMDEAGWLKYTGELHTRPIMPDFALRAMTEDDRRALYRFIRSLGPGGTKAPEYLPPGQTPPPPYLQMVLPPAPAGAAPSPPAG